MREKWILETKKADFASLACELGVMPPLVRCMVNRGITEKEEMLRYLHGSIKDLYDPFLMTGMEAAVKLVREAAARGEKAAVASDFDCDGIFSAYILWRGLGRIGMDVRIYTPDRIKEGYGLNRRIVDEAAEDGRTFLITCDNGIAAHEETVYAKEKKMTVVVTDHHEIQGSLPVADAILDPKRADENYPFCGLCGAGVAFKLIDALYKSCGIGEEEKWELLPFAAIATVADVMELRDENRIMVKEGLALLNKTENPGLSALLSICGLEGKPVSAGHIGFRIGPCFNAAGRIADVEKSFALLMEEDPEKARKKAEELVEINESRKAMTEEGAKRAYHMLESVPEEDLPPVLVLLLSDVHESLAGIIAGRIRERYHHPTIVFTRTEEGIIKGSGRSIDAYDMFGGLMKCKDLMIRFGGHRMAAGMTIREADLEELKSRLCTQARLLPEDFRPVVRIDAPIPIGYVTERFVREIEKMEPFGNGNPKPLFAEQHYRILRARRLGKERNVLKMQLENERGDRCEGVMFRGIEEFEAYIGQEWGDLELQRMYEGRENRIDTAFTYYPEINEYGGRKSVQMIICGYCRITS